MALSNDLRERVIDAVRKGGQSCRAAAQRFEVSVASAVRWVKRYDETGETTASPCGGDRRSGRIEEQRDYLLGLIRRKPDITLLEIQQRLVENCRERFSISVLWRFFDRRGITFKKNGARRGANARGRVDGTAKVVRKPTRSRPFEARFHR